MPKELPAYRLVQQVLLHSKGPQCLLRPLLCTPLALLAAALAAHILLSLLCCSHHLPLTTHTLLLPDCCSRNTVTITVISTILTLAVHQLLLWL
jgi:hypothetical protein